MEQGQLKSIVEAMVFVAEEPLTEQAIVEVLQSDGVDKAQVREAIEAIKAAWNDNTEVGVKIIEVAGGYQFRTKSQVAEWVKRLTANKPTRLSQAAMETLAIVAYRQPIIRSEVEHVRGVDCGGVLKTLLERRLVRIVGKRDEPGQPLIYGTTREFMELFGLGSLKDLPALADLKEIAERRTVGQGDAEEDEEPTAVIRQDEEEDEPTEIILRLEHDEDEDKEALANLENNIKGLRKLEKAIFPKPAPTVTAGAEGTNEGSHEGSSDAQEQGAAPPEGAATAAPDLADDDAPEPVDRSRE